MQNALPAAQMAALIRVLRGVYDPPGAIGAITPQTAAGWAEEGWDAATVARVADLARFAVAHGLPIALDPDREKIRDLGTVFRRLTNFADYLLTQFPEMSHGDTLPWLAVIAGTPQSRTIGATAASERLSATLPLRRLATTAAHGMWVTGSHESMMGAWLAALPGEVAALAWMAGLTVAEAGDRWRAGTLNQDALRALAGLRGYLQPPPPDEHE